MDGVATSRPAGRLSVKSNALLSSVLAELSILSVSVLGVPTATVSGAKALENKGADVDKSSVFITPLVVKVVGPKTPTVVTVVVKRVPVTNVYVGVVNGQQRELARMV